MFPKASTFWRQNYCSGTCNPQGSTRHRNSAHPPFSEENSVQEQNLSLSPRSAHTIEVPINYPELYLRAYLEYEICWKCGTSYIGSETKEQHKRITEHMQADTSAKKHLRKCQIREFTIHIRATQRKRSNFKNLWGQAHILKRNHASSTTGGELQEADLLR